MKAEDSINSLYGTGLIALGAFYLIYRFIKTNRNEPQDVLNNRKRRLSFSSKNLLQGSFPDDKKVWQPIINNLIKMKRCPSVNDLTKKCQNLMYYDRFRSAGKELNGEFILYDLEDDVDPQRDIIQSFEINDEDEMEELVNTLVSKDLPLFENKPLWKMIRIVNKNQEQKSALLVRVHHVIGDGISLIGAMGKVFENPDGTPYEVAIPETIGKRSKGGSFITMLLKVIGSVFEVLSLTLLSYDSEIVFNQQPRSKLKMGEKIKTISLPPVSLDFIKKLKNVANVTVNDILFSATAGMIRKYCESKSDPAFKSNKKLLVRALMPIAFPRPKAHISSANRSLRNLWAFVSASLPINQQQVESRVKSCYETTNYLKSSPNALVQLFLLNKVLPWTPKFFQKQVAFDLFSRHSMVFSNVPGPSSEVFVCGERVLDIEVIFPNILPQVLIISYNGGVYYSISIDTEIVDHYPLLKSIYIEELLGMAKAYNLNVTEEDILHKTG